MGAVVGTLVTTRVDDRAACVAGWVAPAWRMKELSTNARGHTNRHRRPAR
jgi:hypothetical protein